MRKLLRAKYEIASMATGKSRSSTAGRPVRASGAISSYMWEATQIAEAPADRLKSVRIGVRFSPRSQNVPTRASSTTMNVAREGPNQRTAENTKTSETERRAL